MLYGTSNMHSVEYCHKIPRDHAIALNFFDRQAKAHKEMNVRPSQHEARHDTQHGYLGNNSTSTKKARTNTYGVEQANCAPKQERGRRRLGMVSPCHQER